MKKIVLLLLLAAMVASCEKDKDKDKDDDTRQTIRFEDRIFEAYIIENFDTDSDGKISANEAAEIEELFVNEMGITSLKGIEAFVNLTELYCYDNNLSTLDLSKNTALTELWCWDNNLRTLDLSKNTALTFLSCFGNKLTALNVDKNTKLEYLHCQYNLLVELDVSKNVKLDYLFCDSNPNLLKLYMFEGQEAGLDNFQKDVQTVIAIR